MRIDERLHEAMHEYADEIEPEVDSWARIESRLESPAARPRPVSGLVVAGVALVTVLALVGALLAVRDTGGDGRVSTSPAAGMPSRILAIRNGETTVLDARRGTALPNRGRVGIVPSDSQIAVSPVTQHAYVPAGEGEVKGCRSVLRFSLEGPAHDFTTVADDATDPAVSPDGRYLAYLHCLPGDDRPDEIVLRDLATGAEHATGAPAGTFFRGHVWFASDSRHVAYWLHEDALGRDTLRELDLVEAQVPPGRLLPVDTSVFWFGYRGGTGELLGSLDREVIASGTTGAGRHSLFRLPRTVTAAASDASGRHVLAVANGELYRWSEGDKSPSKIADGITGAAWIPDPPRAPAAPRPKEVVALTSKFDLVVMDASTGHVMRELAHDVSVRRGTPELAPTPDGKAVYFTSYLPPDPSGQCPGTIDVVMKVSTSGGVVGHWANGSSVAVSPDGRWLATVPLVRRGSCLDEGTAVEVRDLVTGKTRNFAGTAADTVVRDLSWSAGAHSLAFLESNRSSPGAQTSVLDVERSSSLSDAACMCEWSDAQGPYAFRGSSGNLVGAEGKRVVAADPGTRRFLPDLFVAEYPVDGPVRSDPTGRHLLLTLLVPDGPRTSRGALYRWSEGDRAPTKIADGILAAAWIPGTTASAPPPQTARVVTVMGGTRFEVLNASNGTAWYVNGRALKVPGRYTDVGGVSASNDGRTIVFAHPARPGGCGSDVTSQPQIDRLDLATGATETIVGGAFSPAVSSKGLVAYGIECDGHTLGFTDLATGENYRSDPLGSRTTEASLDSVEPLGWSPDGTALVYRLRLSGDPRAHYYVGRLWPAVRQAETHVVEIPYDASITGATFVDADTVAIAESTASGARVRTYDTVARKYGAELFPLPEGITSVVADPSGAHFLAVTRSGVVFRWREGNGPYGIAEDVSAVAWLAA